MPAEVRGDFIGWLKRAGGIDFGVKLDITGEAGGVVSNPGGVFRRGGRGLDDLTWQAAEEYYLRPGQEADTGAFAEMVRAAVRGERVLNFEEQMMAASREQHLQALGERLETVEGRLKLLGVDTTPAAGNVVALEAYAKANEPAILASALDEARAVDEFSPAFEQLQQQARLIAQDMADGGRTLQQYESDVRPLSPVMRRLVTEETRAARSTPTQNPEAAAPARGAGEAAAAPAVPEPRVAAAQAARLSPGESAEAGAVAARLERVRADFPDLMVRMDGDEAPRPLAEFLAAAQREADEMLADAPLMQVAAECAILNGTGA